jgi:hypothetical protein
MSTGAHACQPIEIGTRRYQIDALWIGVAKQRKIKTSGRCSRDNIGKGEQGAWQNLRGRFAADMAPGKNAHGR